ncbi:MAG: metallophosphoesterase [Fibrobacterota bacterium]
MKTSAMIIFFTVFLSLYGLINYYLFIRGLQALTPPSPFRGIYITLFLFLSLAFIAGRLLERAGLTAIGVPLNWVGSFWFGAMTYFFFIVVFVDMLRLVNLWLHFFPPFIADNLIQARREAFFVAFTAVVLLMAVGYYQALNLRVRTLDLSIAKPVPGRKTLNIVMASDIHLGVIVGRKRFDRMVGTINALAPDIVLLPGDIVDEDLAPVLRGNIGESLKRIRAPLGVYACTGNHEYIGGVEAACRYLSEHNIRMLRDASELVDNAFNLVGREDYSSVRFSGIRRKPLKELMRGVDRSRPVILLDHEPHRLNEATAEGVDLQLSGHTHHGQFWPINCITKRIFELSYGYMKKGNTHIYVSSGAGTWGPPIRLVAWPEIVNIRVRFGE